jgi:hypothetical protein
VSNTAAETQVAMETIAEERTYASITRQEVRNELSEDFIFFCNTYYYCCCFLRKSWFFVLCHFLYLQWLTTQRNWVWWPIFLIALGIMRLDLKLYLNLKNNSRLPFPSCLQCFVESDASNLIYAATSIGIHYISI